MDYVKKRYFIPAFMLLALIVYGIVYSIHTRTIEMYLTKKTDLMFLEYKTIDHNHKNIADLIFQTEIDKPHIIELFKNRKRQKLYQHLLSNYEKYRFFSVRQLHFHLPNNDSFLRMHRPTKFGDNLSKVRATVKFVNENKKSINGFEEGKIFNGFRFVYPLFDGTKHIGSVEISFSALAFVKEITSNYKIKSNFLIDKNVVSEKVFKDEQSNYVQSPIPEYYFQKSILKYMKINVYKKVLSKIESNNIYNQIQTGKPFSIYDNEFDQVVTFIPMKNPITKRVTATLTFHSNDVSIKKDYESSVLIFFITTGIIGLVLLLVYNESRNKRSLRYKIAERTQELLDANKKLEEMAHIDALTGAYNRRYFYEISKKLVSFTKREKTPLSLVMFDIDLFKNINDSYGHDIGDQVLKVFVTKIKNNIRESDVFVRYGGEEFILLLPNTDLEHAMDITEKLRKTIEDCNVFNDVRFTVSAGVSSFVSYTGNLEYLIKRADEALYKAKNMGRNRVVSSEEI